MDYEIEHQKIEAYIATPKGREAYFRAIKKQHSKPEYLEYHKEYQKRPYVRVRINAKLRANYAIHREEILKKKKEYRQNNLLEMRAKEKSRYHKRKNNGKTI